MKSLVFLSFVTVIMATTALNDSGYWPAGNFIQWTDLTLMQNNDAVIVVDQSGAGNSTTVQGAIDLVAVNNPSRVKIVINHGIYNENVIIPRNKPYISMIGRRDSVTGELPVITSSRKSDGKRWGFMYTATLHVEADYFVASLLTIENTAHRYGSIGLAIRIDGDKSVFHQMNFLGTQSTIMDLAGLHFFYHCYIEGDVNFISGMATSIYEGCTLNSTRAGAIAAHARETPDGNSGFLFLNCKIHGVGPTLLGRAWGEYPKIVYSFCTMDGIINPRGWGDWGLHRRQNTSFFAEYMNEGPGSNLSKRVSWLKTLTNDEGASYVGRNFINADEWLRI